MKATDIINLVAASAALVVAVVTWLTYKLSDGQVSSLISTVNAQIRSVEQANANSAQALSRTQDVLERLIDRL